MSLAVYFLPYSRCIVNNHVYLYTVQYSTVTKRVICKLYLKEHLPKKHKKLEKCFAFLLGPKRGKIVFDQIKGKQHFEVSLNS